MTLQLIIASAAAFLIIYVQGGLYTADEDLPVGVITKYLKGKTEVSCLLQCERDEQCDKVMFKLNNKKKRNGECWFVMKISNDTKNEIKDMKQDKSIRSFKKVPAFGNTTCDFGTCVKTDELKEYKHECREEWVLLQRNVCVGALPMQFGKFKIQQDAIITGIKLQHVGGTGLTCMADVAPTKWGCDFVDPWTIQKVGVLIADEERNILFPSNKYPVTNGYYLIPGYNANSPYLIFNATNHTVYNGQELRLYYGEAFHDFLAYNNHGISCADIFGSFCDI